MSEWDELVAMGDRLIPFLPDAILVTKIQFDTEKVVVQEQPVNLVCKAIQTPAMLGCLLDMRDTAMAHDCRLDVLDDALLSLSLALLDSVPTGEVVPI